MMQGATDGSTDVALLRLLLKLTDRVPPAQIDRLWLFPVRAGAGRDTGLIVISTLPPDPDAETCRVLTLRYQVERTGRGTACSDTLAEQGTAPADRIGRVIDGVIGRLGEDAGEPVLHRIAGDDAAWSALLASIGGTAVDPTSGE